jgi:hypothetical protein
MKWSDYPKFVIGADPEVFIRHNSGRLMGSSQVIPIEGLVVDQDRNTGKGILVDAPSGVYASGTIVRDGVQAELHPLQDSCRQILGSRIGMLLNRLSDHLAEHDAHIDFSVGVTLDDAFKAGMQEHERQLGCLRSENIHKPDQDLGVDGATYEKRSAGGHLHLEVNRYVTASMDWPTAKLELTTLVPLLDFFVGLPCVLLDRDPGNAERRKVYGRAGEYRLPKYGLEYRTLSNFWLRSYPTTSMVTGMVRMAVACWHHPAIVKKLKESLDAKKMVQAINDNDFDLALSMLPQVQDFTHQVVDQYEADETSKKYLLGAIPMYTDQDFARFVTIGLKGLDHYFDKDPMKNWKPLDTAAYQFWDQDRCPAGEVVHMGWEKFLATVNVSL